MANDQDSLTGTMLIRRRIGRKFVALREAAGLTQQEAADALERARATLGRIESGESTVRFRRNDVLTMLDLYKANDKDRELLLGLTAETRNGVSKSWRHDRTETSIPDWFDLYVSLEDEAQVIRQYEAELVPGLLQTAAYAEMVMRSEIADENEIRRRVNARLSRQQLLHRPRAPRLEVILNEAALYRIVGAGDLADEQLKKLVEMSSHGSVDMRLLPFRAGIHAGMATSAGFSILMFPEDPETGEELEPSLVYLDSVTGSTYAQKPAEVSIYMSIWTRLREVVLSPQETRSAIADFVRGRAQ